MLSLLIMTSLLVMTSLRHDVIAAEFCPPETKLVTDEPGCHICVCCRHTTEKLLVQCQRLNLTTIPDLPENTYILWLYQNNLTDIRHFPKLTKLTQLNINGLEDGTILPKHTNDILSRPVEVNTPLDLPNLVKLTVFLNLHGDTNVNLLTKLPKLKELNIGWKGVLTPPVQQSLFDGTNLTKIQVYGPGFRLNHTLFPHTDFEIELFGVPQHTSIDVPGATVKLQTMSVSSSQCLNLDFVSARRVEIVCFSNFMDLQAGMFNRIMSLNQSVEIDLKIATFQSGQVAPLILQGSRSLVIDKLTLTFLTGTSMTFITEVSQAFVNTSIKKVALHTAGLMLSNMGQLGTDFFHNLAASNVEELVLYRMNVRELNRTMIKNLNLTKFVCQSCQIQRFASNTFQDQKRLRNLEIHYANEMTIDLNSLLESAPELEHLSLDFIKNLSLINYSNLRHDNLEILSIRSRATFQNMRLSGLKKLRRLDLGLTDIKNIGDDLLKGLVNLETFYFDQNGKVFVSSLDIFSDLFNLKHLVLAYTDLHIARGHVGDQDTKLSSSELAMLLAPLSQHLMFLNLASGNLHQLSPELFKNFISLKYLDLSGNKLKTLPTQLFQDSRLLTEIRGVGNRIEYIDPRTFKHLQYLRRFYFHSNRFRCDCNLRDFRAWIRAQNGSIMYRMPPAKTLAQTILTSSEPDINTEVCYYPHHHQHESSRVIDYHVRWLDCDGHLELVISLSTIALLLLVILTLGISLAYTYRYDLLLMWYVRKRVTTPSGNRGNTFDGFLSYCSEDTTFALKFLEKVESDPDLKQKLAFDQRDFCAGEFIADNIVDLMYRSEKIIFLISRRFLEKEWTKYELRLAQTRCFEEKTNLIILVFIETIPSRELPKTLQALSRRINYLQWPGEEDRRGCDLFWKRVKLSLCRKSSVEKSNPV